MRKTAFFVDNIDHMPSKQLLKEAGFTDQDINQEVFFSDNNHNGIILH